MEVDPKDKAFLIEEIKVFAEKIKGDTGDKYASLLKSVEEGHVSEELLRYLERLLEIGFETGRFTKIYGREGEQTFLRIYHRTLRGSRILSLLKETNRTLTALTDQVIRDISFSLKSPGAYRLVIDTNACQVTLGIDPDGAKVENIEIGI